MEFQTIGGTDQSDHRSGTSFKDGVLIVGKIKANGYKSANISHHGKRFNSVDAFQFYEQTK